MIRAIQQNSIIETQFINAPQRCSSQATKKLGTKLKENQLWYFDLDFEQFLQQPHFSWCERKFFIITNFFYPQLTNNV